MKIFLYGLTVILLLGGFVFAYIKLSAPDVVIPKETRKEVTFPLYTPGWLPTGYRLDQDSFAWQDGRVFVFTASDLQKNKLFFTQQAKPKDFDFDAFYNAKVINPDKLQGTKFESVYAQSLYGNTYLLSIVTDKSWIMMSTYAPIDRAMVQKIAQEIKEYY